MIWFVVLGGFLGAWLLLGLGGRQQTRQGAGSIGRLTWVSGFLALGTILPGIAWAAAEGLGHPVPPEVGTFALGLNGVLLLLWMSPVRTQTGPIDLPPVQDPELLGRIADIARRQGIDPPPARLMTSPSGSMQTLAAIAGLAAPVLLVTDGILHRLETAERDAILGHELAHLSTGSLWLFAAIGPLATVLAVVAGASMSLLVVLPLTLLLYGGARRVIGRAVEVRCDLRSGATTSYAAMSSAVAKIHAIELPNARGLLPLLFHATSTHPSLTVRRAALRAAAPAEEATAIQYDEGQLRAERRMARAALGGWLGLLVSSVAVAQWDERVAAGILASVVVAFFGMRVRFARHKTRSARLLLRGSRRWTPLVPLFELCGTLLIVLFLLLVVSLRLGHPLVGLFGALVFAVVGGVSFVVSSIRVRASNRLRHAVARGYLQGDLAAVVALSAEVERASKDPGLRNDVALAHGATGDRARASELFRALIADAPRFPRPRINLAVVLLQDDPDGALHAAEGAAALVPEVAGPQILMARALRLLGRLDEAEAAIEVALSADSDDGSAHAVASWLASDQGQPERAAHHLERARELAPGHPFIAVARALGAGSPDDVSAAVEEVQKGASLSPLAFIDAELAALRARAPSD